MVRKKKSLAENDWRFVHHAIGLKESRLVELRVELLMLLQQVSLVASEFIRRDVEVETQLGEEFDFQRVEFENGDASNLSICSVVVVDVAFILGCNHNTGDQEVVMLSTSTLIPGLYWIIRSM